jgi:hypothetical protein
VRAVEKTKPNSGLFHVALGICIGLAVSYSYIAIAANVVINDLLWTADFIGFYTGGAIVRDDLGERLYDLELQARYQQEILAGHNVLGELMAYIVPPHDAIIFALPARLPLQTAYGIMAGVQVLLLIGTLGALWRIGAPWTPRERVLAMGGLLAFYPLLSTFLLGALSLLVLLCLLHVYLALKRRGEISAAAWLLLISVKPQTAVLPALALLFARRWRAILTVGLGGLALVGFTALWLGPHIWVDFVENLRLTSSAFDKYCVYPSGMHNLKGTLTIALGKQNATLINAVSLGGFLLSVGATAWLWRGPYDPDRPDFELRLSITLTLALLFGLHVNPQDSLLLVAPTALFYEYLRRAHLPRRAYGVFVWICLPLYVIGELGVRERLGIRLPVIAMLILLGWQVNALWHARARTDAQHPQDPAGAEDTRGCQEDPTGSV